MSTRVDYLLILVVTNYAYDCGHLTCMVPKKLIRNIKKIIVRTFNVILFIVSRNFTQTLPWQFCRKLSISISNDRMSASAMREDLLHE